MSLGVARQVKKDPGASWRSRLGLNSFSRSAPAGQTRRPDAPRKKLDEKTAPSPSFRPDCADHRAATLLHEPDTRRRIVARELLRGSPGVEAHGAEFRESGDRTHDISPNDAADY